MRLLAATAVVLLLGVANATLDLSMIQPKFVPHKIHSYDFKVNITSGVPGLSSKVSKACFQGVAKIYAATKDDLYLKIQNVKVSESLISVGSATDPIETKPSPELERHLELPVKFRLVRGRVISYTLDDKESLQSKKLKKVLMRKFEMEPTPANLRKPSGPTWWPVTFNVSKSSPVGNYSCRIIITSSPYTDFPKDLNVVNVTRTDNYETIPYLAYHSHHNYEKQGCPEVCKKDHVENRFGAGCPVGYEPYQTPMKKSFVQHHNLKKIAEGITTYDIIRTKETHVADIYDQNMEVAIESLLRFKSLSSGTIPEPTGQQTYTDLNDWRTEVNEQEIATQCKYPTAREAIVSVKKSLTKITEVIYKGSIDSDEAKNVGEKLVLLQKGLALLKRRDLEDIQKNDIVSYEAVPSATEQDKIKRQIWLDNLPLIGSSESIYFIVDLIKKNINERSRAVISLWECKSILEALPMNIWKANAETIQSLSKLLEVLHERTRPGYGMFYSAAHIAVARVIRNTCAVTNGISEVEDNNRQNYLQRMLQESDEDYNRRECPRMEAKKFIRDVVEKLKSTTDKLKRVIYIESLSQTGLKAVIPVLKPYVYGHVPRHSESYVDYVKTVAINTLHNLVGKHPKEVKDIVLPIFANKTEAPKIRNSAFGVFIKCSPTLGDLQHIAEQSWFEPSEEVGSYVTTTLETYGNSTIPCHQLLAMRIKKVLPQAKRCANGNQHAQNILRTAFDEIRGFGIENRFEFTPSNESFIPSTMYAAFGYNADSLRDVFFKYALNSQGFNSRNLWDNILKSLGWMTADDIPKDKESAIFPEAEIADRDPEFWRFTFFQKQFYSTAFYYMDAEEFKKGDIISLWKQHMSHLFKIDGRGNIKGHLVRVWMPSSYQSKAFAQALPYPVQFEMRNPMIMSLKVNIKRTDVPGGPGFTVDITPSYYHSMLYTNQMLNLGDCKHVGVYHEKKSSATYPIKFFAQLKQTKEGVKMEGSYSFPELPKKIFVYHSEAGTYARKPSLEVQPNAVERKTIKTIPSPFWKKNTFGVIGLPLFASSILTEDISLNHREVPRNNEEVLQQFIEDFLNPGWRPKTIEISRVEDEKMWNKNTKVVIHMKHQHSNVHSQRQPKSDDNWSDNIDFETHEVKKDEREYKIICDRLKVLTHIHDNLFFTVEHKHNDKVENKAQFVLDHNRTYEGDLHALRIYANATVHGEPIAATTKFATFWYGRPNEFKYGSESYGKQKGIIIGSIRFSDSVRPYAVVKVILSNKPLGPYLNKELQTSVPAEYFMPETHKECERDVRAGKSHSVPCMKAICERSIYNWINFDMAWEQEIPRPVKDILEKIDLAVKHALYSHLSIEKKTSAEKRLRIVVTFINKMTDKLRVDVEIRKPRELMRLRKVDASAIQPVSSIYSLRDTYTQYYTNNTYPASCALMENYVRTYDLKTIRLPKEGSCSYVLTSHCVRHKKFAVIVKIKAGNARSKDIHLYIGKRSIVLTPGTHSKYVIKYDDKDYPVIYQRPIMLHETQNIYAVTSKTADGLYFLEVFAQKTGIKVTYDGQHVKIEVHPRYKGELCGLCSEFNGELVRELRGPNRCLYEDVDDFTASCGLGHCYRPKPVRRYICNGEDHPFTDNHAQDDIDESSKEQYGKN